METEVVSIRINKSVKDTLKRAGLDINAEVKKYLDELAWKIESAKHLEHVRKIIGTKVKPSKPGFAVKSVREDRDEGH